VPVSPSKLLEFYNPEDKKERCGLILKKNRVIEVVNSHPDPEHGFEISPDSIIRHEDQLQGTWHTHPGGAATLSNEDYACFINWPHLEHYIVGEEGVRRYAVEDGVVYNVD
jgi:proteasome lid subunit RPN8/RPN11